PSDFAPAYAARRSRRRSVSNSILQRSAVDDELLFPVFSQGIETPGSGASEGQIEEHEAEQDREIAAIEDGQEAPWRMSDEIGKRHLARENEGNWTGEQAQYHQRAANELERSGKAVERKQRHILERRHGRKFQQLCHSILQKQQAGHDAPRSQWCNDASGLRHAAARIRKFQPNSSLIAPVLHVMNPRHFWR